ncbi:TonB-dependent receptor [Pseudoduganella lutea]|uniref:TonB-dependent receptor n=2 Tax=Pseudoduganella lutea TaxID=321985 RepID=A0A4P6L8K8_9BURK|nr:TonB-dependent receptor [Pseudoduganella lutea]
MAGSTPAVAQQAAAESAEPIQKVQVIATRASQQSGIERKKNAATAMDSIVAEDVGAFPDRNVAEAISRIAGVAVDRGDFGEGVNVTVRGNAPDLTRVEIDGQGVQAGGGTDLNGGGSGRGVELREISADLIKSVDIVKGATADQTEGGLGGSIIIKTRTGLDFKKPFYSLRLSGAQNSLNKDWTPDGNLVIARQFMDGRLGMVVNGSASQVRNEGHSAQVATGARQGYARAIDFDNSPEKTFAFNPATVSTTDATATEPALRSALTNGGFFDASSPLDVVTRSAAAQTKADCDAAFPDLTQAEINAIKEGNTRTGAINHRGNERLSCLNQWNDYTPSLVRYVQKRQIDKRRSLDLRLDFKVNNELTVYGKGSYQRRRVDDNFLTYNLGGMAVNPASTAGPTYAGAAFTEDVPNNRLVPVAGSGYHSYATPSWRRENAPWSNSVVNVDPASVVVDENHHVTKFTISDGNVGTDQIHNVMETSARYLQLGGSYRKGGLFAEFMAGDAKSDFTRGDKRTSWNYNYGPATMSVLPNGLWTYAFPQGGGPSAVTPAQYATLRPASAPLTEVKAANNAYVGVPAYSIAQQPLTTLAPQIVWTPKINETGERTAKLDLTYALPESIPFLTRFKSGFNLRDTRGNSWGAGGFEARSMVGEYGKPGYERSVLVPSANVRSTFVGCQDTPGSLGAGGKPCQYGYVPSNSHAAASIQSGQTTFTQAQFQDIIAQSMHTATTNFFNGAKDRPAELINGWTEIDVEKVFGMVGAPNVNFDCVKECTGTDGQVYQQPVNTFRERTKSGYLMTDFALDHVPFSNRPLPFGMELEGNAGVRIVNTRVEATGRMNFTSIIPTANFDPLRPNAPGGTVTATVSKLTTLESSETDYLPIWNLALWMVPNEWVVRYNQGKSVARPGINQLVPSGTCTFDATQLSSNGDDADMRCSGTVGNPALRPQSNVNQNVTLEWYPNADSQFSLATFRQRGKIGPSRTTGVSGVKVFQGSNLVDPQTGTPLDDVDFSYNTYENGAATTRKGFEFSSKTAFTFLPWRLRYLGLDVNYTRVRSAMSAVNVVDLITGDPLPPARESKYSYNWSLWYDDGKLSARVAVQADTGYFTCIAACGDTGVNNFPNAAGGRTTVLPYNPGSPNFKDASRFIDAKVAYRFNDNIEVFAEARNLGKETTSNSQGAYSTFADGTPSLLDYAYAGRKLMFGINLRN